MYDNFSWVRFPYYFLNNFGIGVSGAHGASLLGPGNSFPGPENSFPGLARERGINSGHSCITHINTGRLRMREG